MSRDWRRARAKVDAEGKCRYCGGRDRLETAHIIGRRHDEDAGEVDPDAVIPLCQEHHRAYDLGALDVLPVLKLDEQALAVRQLGILRAWRRITGSAKTDTPSTG